MRLDAVFVDANDDRICGFERFDFITEIGGLRRSAGGAVFGVEIEDHGFAEEILERHFAAVVRVKRKRGRFLSNFDHSNLLLVNSFVRGGF